MIKRYVMSGALQKIDNLSLGIVDVNDPDFDNTGNEAEGSFGRSYTPQILFRADPENIGIIYIGEHASSGSDELYPLRAGESFQINWSYIKAMNIFYVTGSSSELLYVVVR